MRQKFSAIFGGPPRPARRSRHADECVLGAGRFVGGACGRHGRLGGPAATARAQDAVHGPLRRRAPGDHSASGRGLLRHLGGSVA
eukprot:8561413-Heterocapsa_arctica.AAC.1